MPLPEPHPGLVISHSYLWQREANLGRTEGAKDRPAVIVLAVHAGIGSAKMVTVAPITHAKPAADAPALEPPPRVKAHLRLDDEGALAIGRCQIVGHFG